MYGTIWALLPPVVAIVLALITKEVYSSLFIGIVTGALIYTGFSPIATLDTVINEGFINSVADAWNIGIFMFLISESFTQVMLEQLLGFPVEAGAYDELASSAIAEVGNIMCCSYINALSSLLGFKVEVSVPEVSRDMVGSLLSVPIIYFADHSDNLLLIEDRYFIDDQSIVSHVLFLPNLESLKRIFSAVGEPYGR